MAVAAKKKNAPKADNVVARARRGAASAPRSQFREIIGSLGGALLIYLVLRIFLVEAFRIPSGSMKPTLLVGDWLFVNKLVYGPHLPFTHVNLPGYGTPRRGDVAVFESPYQADEAAIGNDPTPTLVKRLVGMPGDTIYMRKGQLYVDGIAQRQGWAARANAAKPPEGTNPDYVDPLFAWQHKFELAHSRFGDAPATPSHDNWGPLVVPQGYYWMMGDNRYESKDGRYWGFVPRANFRGRPLFIYYSYNADDSDRILPFITDIRWGRIGSSIH